MELFFEWVKKHLKFKRFYGTSYNAVINQIYPALIIYCALKLLHIRLGSGYNFLKIVVYSWWLMESFHGSKGCYFYPLKSTFQLIVFTLRRYSFSIFIFPLFPQRSKLYHNCITIDFLNLFNATLLSLYIHYCSINMHTMIMFVN